MAAVECVVIGGGVVGLACARAAALRGLEASHSNATVPK
jgi:glycerol-3-phosphate dehydrogenase